MSISVNCKLLNGPDLPRLVLSQKESEEDADVRSQSRELLRNLYPPLYLFEATFNDVCGRDVVPSVRRMVHIDNTDIQILF